MSVGVAIVGFGYMGHFHRDRLAASDGAELLAICDCDRERREEAEALGLLAYDTLDGLLGNPEIELVLICTPNDVHAKIAEEVLAHGKHVMSEKPVTMNTTELEHVLAIAQKHDRIFVVHQNRRWDCDFLAVKNALDSGVIGQPTTIESKVFGQRGVCFGWRADADKGGGMLLDWGVHLIDQALLLFPDQKVVNVYARMLSILTPDVDDYFELRLRFEKGVEFHIFVGTFALEPQPRWYVLADRGTLRMDTFDPSTTKMKRIRKDVKGFESVVNSDRQGPTRTMAPLKQEYLEELAIPDVQENKLEYHRNLLAAVRGVETTHVKPDEMVRVMRIVDLARESSENNEILNIEV